MSLPPDPGRSTPGPAPPRPVGPDLYSDPGRLAAPGLDGSVDSRGPRFAAWVTSAVLAVVFLAGSGWLLAAQAVVFALGAFVGLRYAPYAVLYRALIAPRLSAPVAREAAAPLRFAQGVGFVFAAVGAIAYLSDVPVLGLVATAFALVAAFLNAAFGLCLGCETYLLFRRLTTKGVPA